MHAMLCCTIFYVVAIINSLSITTYTHSRPTTMYIHTYIHTGVSSVLLLLMGYRFYNSGKIMPAGLVTALR